jgi:hypothetical protein
MAQSLRQLGAQRGEAAEIACSVGHHELALKFGEGLAAAMKFGRESTGQGAELWPLEVHSGVENGLDATEVALVLLVQKTAELSQRRQGFLDTKVADSVQSRECDFELCESPAQPPVAATEE